jgi:hypothetical protein
VSSAVKKFLPLPFASGTHRRRVAVEIIFAPKLVPFASD